MNRNKGNYLCILEQKNLLSHFFCLFLFFPLFFFRCLLTGLMRNETILKSTRFCFFFITLALQRRTLTDNNSLFLIEWKPLELDDGKTRSFLSLHSESQPPLAPTCPIVVPLAIVRVRRGYFANVVEKNSVCRISPNITIASTFK